MKCRLYIAKTYFLVNDILTDERLACIGETFDDVEIFIQGVRMLPIIPEDHDYELPIECRGAVAVVETAEFFSEYERDNYLHHEKHEPYILQPYGPVDHHMAHMSKKEGKCVKLPAILIEAIDRRTDDFLAEIRVANHTLRELLLYVNGNDRSRLTIDPSSVALLKACKLLDEYLNKEDRKFERSLYSRSPLLFCDEKEYRDNLDMLLFHKGIDSMYRDRIMDPDA